MVRVLLVLQAFVIVLVVLLHSSEAHAQATRTWVSSVGDDVNGCTRTAPCRTFAGALARTAAGGEIDVLDAGGYGTVNITKSVTIDGTGTLGAINDSGANGIVINDSATATPGTAIVTLRGLSISGAGTTLGLRGIHVISAGKVAVEDSVVSSHSIAGVEVVAASSLVLRNVVVRNNAGPGIVLAGASISALLKASIIGCTVVGNSGNGLHAKQHTRVSATRSEFSQNTGHGVFADAVTAGSVALVLLRSSTMAFNGSSGVRAGNAGSAGTSAAKIADCEISGNTGNGVLVSTGGGIGTSQNNRITNNGTDGCPGCTAEGPGT
jgi:hypothetical protein